MILAISLAQWPWSSSGSGQCSGSRQWLQRYCEISVPDKWHYQRLRSEECCFCFLHNADSFDIIENGNCYIIIIIIGYILGLYRDNGKENGN